MTNPELLIVITTSATAIVSIVNAIAAGWGRKEVKKQAEEVKQVAETVHKDIVKQVTEAKDVVKQVVNGNDLAVLGTKIDGLSDRVGHIEDWIGQGRTARTRITDN